MKKYLFIALAVLVAACEKPILDEEDAVTRKEANVILHMTQYEQEAFGNSGNRAVQLPVPPPTSRNYARV